MRWSIAAKRLASGFSQVYSGFVRRCIEEHSFSHCKGGGSPLRRWTNGVGDSFMPISPQFEEVRSERLAPSAGDSTFAQTSPLLGILLLEDDVAVLSNRSRLLTNSSYRVTEARNRGDIFGLRGTTGISLAIISDSLGAAALGLAAQSVRLEWPSARILILGKAQFVLEDYLYDEAIEHQFVERNVLSTIERICHPSANLGRDGGIFIMPRHRAKADANTSVGEAGPR